MPCSALEDLKKEWHALSKMYQTSKIVPELWQMCASCGKEVFMNVLNATCRWDAACTETVEWQEDAGVEELAAKAEQPFYQVLVDWSDAFSDRSIFSGQSLIAYVAQDMLSVPEVRTIFVKTPNKLGIHITLLLSFC